MRNSSFLAVYAAFALVAIVSSVAVCAPAEPGASVEAITSSIIVPVAQQLPVYSVQNLARN
jgi:hypothetical protein